MRTWSLLFVILMIVMLSPESQAAKFSYDFGAGLHYYAGKETESLAPNTATVVRFGAQAGEEIFRWMTNLQIFSSSGEADFLDAGTTRSDLTYSLIGGEFNIGFGLYPLGAQSKLPLQPYMGASGSVHIDSITFDEDATTSATFPKSDAPMMFGYALFVGADIAFSKEWGMKIHVEKSAVTGTLAESSFGVGGHRITLGLYFQ